MTVNEWVELIQRQGAVCNDYMRKLNAVTNKTELFRVLCDVNGGEWLFELHAKGAKIPIDSFLTEFKNYINGQKVVDYPSGYTSKFYCRHIGEITADTTLVYLLECMDAEITVPKNGYSTIILSHGSQAEVTLEDGARANIETYGDACVNGINGKKSRVKIYKHK